MVATEASQLLKLHKAWVIRQKSESQSGSNEKTKHTKFSEKRTFELQRAYLTHLFIMHLSLLPENIRKPYSFLMFPGGREKVHWE